MPRDTAHAQAGCDPRIMGIGPVPATEKLCAQQSLSLRDFDTIEINEAFAAQALACARGLKLAADDSRFNRHGSGISLGPWRLSTAHVSTTGTST